MQRNKVSLERQINDRLYQFMIPFEAPSWKEVLMIHDDIRSQVMALVQEEEKKAAEAAEKAKSEEVPVVEPILV